MMIAITEAGGRPFKSEGFIDQRAYYFTYRANTAFLTISTNNDPQYGPSAADHIYSYAEIKFPGEESDALNEQEFQALLSSLAFQAMAMAKAEETMIEQLVGD